MMFSVRRAWLVLKLLLLDVAAAFFSHGVIAVPARCFASAILRFWAYDELDLIGVAFFAVAVATSRSDSSSDGRDLVFGVFAIVVTVAGVGGGRGHHQPHIGLTLGLRRNRTQAPAGATGEER